MRPGHAAGRTHLADDAALVNQLARLHVDLAHVAVHGDQPLSMVDKHRVAIKKKFPVSTTSPAAGARIGVPSGAAMSMPLCGLRG